MRKLQLVVRPAAPERHAPFAVRVRDRLVPALLDRDPAGLKVVVTERPPPRPSLVPFSRAPVAVISWWGAEPPAVDEGGLDVDVYEVEEALPVAYEKTWPDGDATPGVCLLTLFRRRRGLDDATFFARWHDGHTPLSLEIHPLFAYVRNVVRRSLDGAAPLDGIVEEQFREPSDLLDPRKMYGHGRLLAALPNMIRVGVDIHGFMDLRGMEVCYATERWIRSPMDAGVGP